MAKLLLGDDLQNPNLNEETGRQILALVQNPIATVTHNLTQPSTSNTQQELVTKVPASLVTTIPTDQGIPPPPPPRGLMPPIKRVLPVKSTEQITEALKEVMLELEPTSPAMKKYRKYLQRQTTNRYRYRDLVSSDCWATRKRSYCVHDCNLIVKVGFICDLYHIMVF